MNPVSGARELFPGDDSGWITAHCDGGSRGNPGPAGFGVYIQDDAGKVLAELSEYVGRKTNNFAEYSGLLAALDFALAHGHGQLRVVSDSELMVKQMKGQYRVNSPELRPLYEEAKRRAAKLAKFQIQHVLREKNRHADRLANLAMDRGMGRTDAAPPKPAATAAAKSRSAPPGAEAREKTPDPARPAEKLTPKPGMLRGFVKGGVVHILGGELPDGVFVKVLPE